ncbi:MAG: DNA-processing protein DprA [Alphaproteobacteria bacterium]|nr:DNA-processing protein DprA [Alphaproteobacteria bacterium]
MTALTREQFFRLQLAFSENVGPITYRDLLRYYKNAEEALSHVADCAVKGGRKRPIKIADKAYVEHQIELATKKDVSIITNETPEFPRLLREIEDCPPFLFVKGRGDFLDRPSVSIVGSRNCTINGLNLARTIASDLVKNKYVVTSGLARGIDGAAHEGALASTNEKFGTVAVLGTGVDVVYPRENEKIYNQIIERGCVVSELPMGTNPSPRFFPRRNRIISGLSLGTVVIEAHALSGSLITAREALSQNREVFAVPGSPLDTRSSGPNGLIKDGAHLVTCSDDILKVLDFNTTKTLLDVCEDKTFDKPLSFISDSDLNKARDVIVSRLSPEVTGVNQLIRGTGLPTELVSIILVELELAGKIERFAGQRIALIYDNEWGN